jgi:hypothetical protein
MAWPAVQGYLSSLLPMRMMAMVPMLVSGIVAATLAFVAFRTNGIVTDD